MPSRATLACPVLLALALLSACAASKNSADSANTVSFKVDGMACPNCAKHIAHELEEVPGVEHAEVDFATKTARVRLDPASPATRDQLNAAVAHWKKEHFAAEEDPECLDPAKREEIKRSESQPAR